MSGLSNRVMNMKFMQKSDEKPQEKDSVGDQKKVKDTSEWVLPNSNSLKAKAKPISNVQSIGYASINSFEDFDEDSEFVTVPVGRKTWGAPVKKEPAPLEVDKIKDSITKGHEKTRKPGKKPEQPEFGTNELVEKLFAKNKEDSAKRKAENKPDIKNKKKRFSNLR